MRRILALLALLASLTVPGAASAAGGNYAFDGGTRAQQRQVRAALDASAFDWSVVPTRVTIHVRKGLRTQATPGHVWLDARLVDSGTFAWAAIQDEYAHQIDFSRFDAATRADLTTQLGARDWCYGVAGLRHAEYGCERFASTLVWAFWPSKNNAYRPRSSRDESAAMPPARFRALITGLLGMQNPFAVGR
jgi:hypothetical protein